jgi:hypothetical protein
MLRLIIRIVVICGRIPRAVLALEGLVRLAAAPLLDTEGSLGFEAVHGLIWGQRIRPAVGYGRLEWLRTWLGSVGCMVSVM